MLMFPFLILDCQDVKFCIVSIAPREPTQVSVAITSYRSGVTRSKILRFPVAPNWRVRRVRIDPSSKWIAVTLNNAIEEAASVWFLDRKTGKRLATYRYQKAKFHDGDWKAPEIFSLPLQDSNPLTGIDLHIQNRILKSKERKNYVPVIRHIPEAARVLSDKHLRWPLYDGDPRTEFKPNDISEVSADFSPVISKDGTMIAAFCVSGEPNRPPSLVILERKSKEWIRQDVLTSHPTRMVFLDHWLSYSSYESSGWGVKVLNVKTGKRMLELKNTYFYDACILRQ